MKLSDLLSEITIEMLERQITKTFLSNIKIPNDSNCWIWTGYKDKDGYGTFGFQYKAWKAHRFSYMLYNDELDSNLPLDHLCRNPSCVNPEHLEQITLRENVLRGISPPAIHARNTPCIHGHELSEGNYYVTRKNGRQCKKCTQQRGKLRR